MQEVISRLQAIDVDSKLVELEKAVKNETNPRKIDSIVKQIKILRNLKQEGLSPEEAFIRRTIPVMPSMYRSPIELPGGILTTPDVNLLIRDIGLANDALRRARNANLPKEDIDKAKDSLRNSINEMAGFETPSLNPKVVKNPFSEISGLNSPKGGIWQKNVIRKRQDLSGRSTASPDAELDIDEIKVPYKMGLKIYEPFLKQRLIEQGYSTSNVDTMIREKDDRAKHTLIEISKSRPVIINRAPSIRKTSVNTMFPIFTEDLSLKVAPWLAGLNPSLDYDGDTFAVHVPVTPGGVRDALKMLPSKNLRAETTGQMLTKPDHAAATGLYKLSLTKPGLAVINSILPDDFKINKGVTKGEMSAILKQIDETNKYNTSDILSKLRKLGDQHIYESGFSIGINDLIPASITRDDVLSKMKMDISRIPKNDRSQSSLRPIYEKYSAELAKSLEKELKELNGPLGEMLSSKSRGTSSQFRDLLASPLGTTGDKLLETPITHSYAEGLDPWEYFNASSGARIGIIGRSQGTALPGALASELLSSANHLVLNNKKHDNMKIIDIPIEPLTDILDRFVAKDVIGAGSRILIKKDTVITPGVVQLARKHGKKTLPVYTPLGSSAPDGSLPGMAYGIGNNGQMHEDGYNIGVVSAGGIVDPLFTSSMGSFHTGGSLQDKVSGYPRIKQLLELPKSLPRKAVLSEIDGIIKSLDADSLGGTTVTIGDHSQYVPASNSTIVRIGDKIKKGDPISDGPQDIRELYGLTNLERAQQYMVDELKEQTPNLKRRNIEAVVEVITRHAEVSNPGDSDYLPGDVDLISKIEDINKGLDNKILYTPIFRGVNTLPQATQGWLSQLGFRNIKREMKKNFAYGAEDEIHGYSPMPALAYGHEFNKDRTAKY